MRLKLSIEPVPVSTWGKSLANRLPRQEWDDLRQKVYRDADYKCKVCEATNRTLHAHEVWRFDDTRAVQHLIGIECLCELCHDVKHFGRSSEVYPKGYVEKLRRHWCEVNGKSLKEFYMYQKEVFEINKKRANKYYVVKIGRRTLT